jgi:hypothetical protein
MFFISSKIFLISYKGLKNCPWVSRYPWESAKSTTTVCIPIPTLYFKPLETQGFLNLPRKSLHQESQRSLKWKLGSKQKCSRQKLQCQSNLNLCHYISHWFLRAFVLFKERRHTQESVSGKGSPNQQLSLAPRCLHQNHSSEATSARDN